MLNFRSLSSLTQYNKLISRLIVRLAPIRFKWIMSNVIKCAYMRFHLLRLKDYIFLSISEVAIYHRRITYIKTVKLIYFCLSFRWATKKNSKEFPSPYSSIVLAVWHIFFYLHSIWFSWCTTPLFVNRMKKYDAVLPFIHWNRYREMEFFYVSHGQWRLHQYWNGQTDVNSHVFLVMKWISSPFALVRCKWFVRKLRVISWLILVRHKNIHCRQGI